ncbi:hypothetical protein LTR16_004872 [Cryomyces antarcticus]|uniref:SMP domain-containing protein n=1 Tax=Cryomyces antarcticus TaxID=329879 RepID=A0ABR0M633_9PEZI|nr:hypothetical protein LTR16_004872 [Cryomyces antarcticus]
MAFRSKISCLYEVFDEAVSTLGPELQKQAAEKGQHELSEGLGVASEVTEPAPLHDKTAAVSDVADASSSGNVLSAGDAPSSSKDEASVAAQGLSASTPLKDPMPWSVLRRLGSSQRGKTDEESIADKARQFAEATTEQGSIGTKKADQPKDSHAR